MSSQYWLLIFCAVLQVCAGFIVRKGPIGQLLHELQNDSALSRANILASALHRPVREEFISPNETKSFDTMLNERPFSHDAYPPEPPTLMPKSRLERWYQRYNDSLLRHPLPTKMLSAALIAALGDLLLQLYVFLSGNFYTLFSFFGEFRLDYTRTLAFLLVSGLYGAPITHYWFNFINDLPFLRRFDRFGRTVLMTLIDQTLGATCITAGFFFLFEIVHGYLLPGNVALPLMWEAGQMAVGKKLLPTLLINWCIWPFVNFYNFYYIPVHLRVLFANVVNIFWNMVLSNMANKPNSF